MTDLELTRLCAEAMFPNAPIHILTDDGLSSVVVSSLDWGGLYDPLHDDAQAMALLKRFHLMVDTRELNPEWNVWSVDENGQSVGSDLNRCIVECVAEMRTAKA